MPLLLQNMFSTIATFTPLPTYYRCLFAHPALPSSFPLSHALSLALSIFPPLFIFPFLSVSLYLSFSLTLSRCPRSLSCLYPLCLYRVVSLYVVIYPHCLCTFSGHPRPQDDDEGNRFDGQSFQVGIRLFPGQ
jgi:hypothetical protein